MLEDEKGDLQGARKGLRVAAVPVVVFEQCAFLLGIAGAPVADISDRDGVKFLFEDASWLLIRPSGTEPVLRTYAEARSPEQVDALLQAGGALAEKQIEILLRTPA